MSSYGMTPYEFVQKVYYVQEKVILDFWPTDDKYKEVLFEANMVLEEFQQLEDWTFLREQTILGYTGRSPCEFEMPPRFYKPATEFKDAVRLHPVQCGHRCHHHHCATCGMNYKSLKPIEALWKSASSINSPDISISDRRGMVLQPDKRLYATWTAGDTIAFNRPLNGIEQHCVAETDMIRRLKPFHICGPKCPNHDDPNNENLKEPTPCPHIEKRVLTEIPDPLYLVYRTACLHAEGSPVQQGRLMTLQDQCQKMLSAIRENNMVHTQPDRPEMEQFTYTPLF